ncbi:MAG: class I SAM-dependent methyltransferase [Acidobacteria bacterium]|nr:class I SAM-dependent methyltransferase [Acidobacteriota bacterium]
MDSKYGSLYRRLYEHHWWWRAREALILRHLLRRRPAGGFGRILDVGCGDGLFFERLAALGDPEGVEPEAALVSPDGPWSDRIHVRPFDSAFEPGYRFGLILMLDVLEHLEDDLAALRHATSLLSPGGLLVITVPAFQSLWTAHDDLNHHFRRYRHQHLQRLASAAGLNLSPCRYFFHWLVPLKLGVRLRERLLPRDPLPPEVPGRLFNELYRKLSLAEQALFSYFPLPFGSSLLAIGRRRL